MDSTGAVYIAASADNTIRKVTTDGVINIFAGAGYKGYYGDYSQGQHLGQRSPVSARPPSPASMGRRMSPSDPKGAILIADTGNGAIRQVDSTGIITSISGNGSIGLSGDGVATTLAMVSPFGVAVDSSGNVYVAEYGTNRIRKVDASGKITTAIGDGIQGFAGDGGPANKVEMSLPTGVAVDSSGNVYFADSLNNRIRKLAGGNVSTVRRQRRAEPFR